MTTETNPRTGRPQEEHDQALWAEEDAARQAELEQDLSWQVVAESGPAKKLTKLLTDKLSKRIEALLQEDQEGAALLDLLRQMGGKNFAASSAAKEIVAKKLRN